MNLSTLSSAGVLSLRLKHSLRFLKGRHIWSFIAGGIAMLVSKRPPASMDLKYDNPVPK